MTDSREQEISQALRQLAADHQQGRLSLAGYRRLRRTLLDKADKDKADKDEALMPMRRSAVSANSRPGILVWLAFVAIVLILATVGWLLR